MRPLVPKIVIKLMIPLIITTKHISLTFIFPSWIIIIVTNLIPDVRKVFLLLVVQQSALISIICSPGLQPGSVISVSIVASVHAIRINKPDWIVHCVVIWTPPPVLVCQWINPMPYAQLRILESCPKVIFLQTGTVGEFLILQLLSTIPELILGILRLH